MKKIIVMIALLCTLNLNANPWGKDADLTTSNHIKINNCSKSKNPLVWGAEKLICFHKTVISPADGPRSHFLPNSSQYTLDAIRKYGFFYGYLLGCDRLMRENSESWIYKTCPGKYNAWIKYDPCK